MKTLMQIVMALPVLFSIAVVPDALAHDDHASGAAKKRPALHQQKAFGTPGNGREVTRTVQIRMLDEMRFAPSTLDVQLGETIRFVMSNQGKLLHELVIGTKEELDAHAAMMTGSGMTHDEPYIAHVPPGKTGEIIWKFNRAGRFDFACLVPGHYQSGMMGTLNVTAR